MAMGGASPIGAEIAATSPPRMRPMKYWESAPSGMTSSSSHPNRPR